MIPMSSLLTFILADGPSRFRKLRHLRLLQDGRKKEKKSSTIRAGGPAGQYTDHFSFFAEHIRRAHFAVMRVDDSAKAFTVTSRRGRIQQHVVLRVSPTATCRKAPICRSSATMARFRLSSTTWLRSEHSWLERNNCSTLGFTQKERERETRDLNYGGDSISHARRVRLLLVMLIDKDVLFCLWDSSRYVPGEQGRLGIYEMRMGHFRNSHQGKSDGSNTFGQRFQQFDPFLRTINTWRILKTRRIFLAVFFSL